MSMHLAAFYQSVDPSAALKQINAVADQAIRTDGVDLVVPSGVANLIGESALTAATGPSFAQVQSPSLRQLANQDVAPIISAVKYSGEPAIQWHGSNPRALRSNESLNFAINATGGAAAANYGLIWMADGPTSRATGNIFTIRGTGAATLSAGSWVNTSVDFQNTLPAGTYNVVGFRAMGANLVAARLVFVGGAFRPGVPAHDAVDTLDIPQFRFGWSGSFGSFDVNQPPTVECLGVTDTAQDFLLDLIKIS